MAPIVTSTELLTHDDLYKLASMTVSTVLFLIIYCTVPPAIATRCSDILKSWHQILLQTHPYNADRIILRASRAGFVSGFIFATVCRASHLHGFVITLGAAGYGALIGMMHIHDSCMHDCEPEKFHDDDDDFRFRFDNDDWEDIDEVKEAHDEDWRILKSAVRTAEEALLYLYLEKAIAQRREEIRKLVRESMEGIDFDCDDVNDLYRRVEII